MKRRSLLAFVIFLFLPVFASAELNSTNYTVVDHSVAAFGQYGNASSTNYDLDIETGGYYIYDAPTDTGGGTTGGTQTVTPTPTTPPPTTPPTTPPDDTSGNTVTPTTPTPSTPSSGGNTNSGSQTSSGSGSGQSTRPSTTTTPTPTQPETPATPTNDTYTPTPDTTAPIGVAAVAKKALEETIIPAIEKIVKFVEPLKQEVARPRSTDVVGVGSAAIVTWFSLARMPFSLSHFGRLFTHGWANILGLFAVKRRRPWGTVYDSVTKAPLDPVYVEIYDQQGVKRGDALTDLDGRYGFLVPEGIYTIKAKKNNYIFPSKHLHVTGEDTIYSHLYFGEQVRINDTAAFDIPMDPIEFDWNQYEKLRTKQTYFFHRLDPILSYIMRVLFYLSIALTAWQYYSLRDVYSLILLIAYIILLVIFFTHRRPPLFGTIKKYGYVLPYAIVKVKYGNTVFAKKVTDQYGRYVALVPNGTYTLEIDERISEREYETIARKEVTVKKGVINEHIEL